MRHFNFILTVITIVVLSIIGVAFIIGAIYSSLQAPGWDQSPFYQDYLASMDLAVLPFVIILLVVLGLCIPKRLFDGVMLLQVNGLLLAATLIIGAIAGLKIGLGFLLVAAGLIQLVVISLTLLGSPRLHFERAGFFLQIGSAFLHLGLVIFLFDFMILAEDPNHLLIFWVATGFIALGMVFSFYSQELARLLRREAAEEALPAMEESV